ncbi:Glucose-1-phosphate adenylyltransferase [Caenispirillum salinarum AK4]|uniref:Glucose-1-phosphate adenylyltransferase n=1 Tax=Caenispirillum salinarum AK4 TaxID=1238182 RepID=K9GU84_9PROT|nr:glucose-1-phosphate adenylyltransferase [Caenispirillum salinarum]EKV28712.1 Glucose-1-phosphate adenylyltransferase [Caenispirillum salinarum AK4]
MDQMDVAYDLNRALKGTLALVLAGGRGSRLMALTDDEAKPAVPFAGKFRIVDFPLSNCINSGIRRIAVPTQYKAHTLIRHIQRGWSFFRAEINEFVELWPAQQQTRDEAWYRGTADAVYQNLDTIRAHDPDYILILAGDHVYRQDYSRMLAHHLESGADVTVSCVEVPLEQAKGFGVVDADADDNIVGFLEKPADPPHMPGDPTRAFASMGIYIFNRPFLEDLLEADAADATSAHDFGKNIIPGLIGRCKLIAHRLSDSAVRSTPDAEPYWRDVGTVDAYWEANLDLVNVTPELDLYDQGWPIWTYQEQLPSAKFVFDNEDRRGMAVDSLVSGGCIISGATVRGSLLFSNVRVNSYSTVEHTVVLPGTDIGRNCRIRNAIIGNNCRVPEGLVVGEDRALDARRFHVTERGVTLITQRMLEALDSPAPRSVEPA